MAQTNTAEQMEMAFMEDGGLQDDGANVDAVSGNEVPSGSMDQEVRDDVPAMLSEGEYVVPADVVRFHGVKLFEDLRMEAKMGMGRMESEGRIGGEPIEEDMDDELPFDISELQTVEEPVREMAEGGEVGPTFTYNPNTRYMERQRATSGFDMRVYINPATGRQITIPFFNGQPMSAIPEGFVLASDQAAAQQTTAQPEAPVRNTENLNQGFIPSAPSQFGFDAFTTEDWANYVKQADGQLAAFTANIPILGTLQRLSESSAKAYAEKAIETGKHPATGADLTTEEKAALQSVLNSSITERKSILESIGDLFKGEPDQNMSPRPDYAKPSLDPYNEAAARLAQEQETSNIQKVSSAEDATFTPAVATAEDMTQFGVQKANLSQFGTEGVAVDNLNLAQLQDKGIIPISPFIGGDTEKSLESAAQQSENPLLVEMNNINYQGDKRAVLAIAEHEGTRDNLTENNMNYSHEAFKKLFGEEKYQRAKELLRPVGTSGLVKGIPRENHEALFNIAYGDVNGNQGADDGFKFRGRGYIQITGRENYRNVGNIVGTDLENMSEEELNTWFSSPQNSAKASVAFFNTGNPDNLQPKNMSLALGKVGGTNNKRKLSTYSNPNFFPMLPMLKQLELGSVVEGSPARPSIIGAAFAEERPEISPTPSFVQGMDAVPQAGAAIPYTTDAAGFAGDIPPPVAPPVASPVTPSFVSAMNQVPQAGEVQPQQSVTPYATTPSGFAGPDFDSSSVDIDPSKTTKYFGGEPLLKAPQFDGQPPQNLSNRAMARKDVTRAQGVPLIATEGGFPPLGTTQAGPTVATTQGLQPPQATTFDAPMIEPSASDLLKYEPKGDPLPSSKVGGAGRFPNIAQPTISDSQLTLGSPITKAQMPQALDTQTEQVFDPREATFTDAIKGAYKAAPSEEEVIQTNLDDQKNKTIPAPKNFKPQIVFGASSLARGNSDAARKNQHRNFDGSGIALTQYGSVQFHPTERAGGGPSKPNSLDIFRFRVDGERQKFIRRYELEKILGKNFTTADIMAFDPTKWKRVNTGEKNLFGVDVGELVPLDAESKKSDGIAPKTAEKLGIKPKGQRESKAEKAARQKNIDKAVAAWKAKQKKPVVKGSKEEQTATGQATGKGYIGGSGFATGGIVKRRATKKKNT